METIVELFKLREEIFFNLGVLEKDFESFDNIMSLNRAYEAKYSDLLQTALNEKSSLDFVSVNNSIYGSQYQIAIDLLNLNSELITFDNITLVFDKLISDKKISIDLKVDYIGELLEINSNNLCVLNFKRIRDVIEIIPLKEGEWNGNKNHFIQLPIFLKKLNQFEKHKMRVVLTKSKIKYLNNVLINYI